MAKISGGPCSEQPLNSPVIQTERSLSILTKLVMIVGVPEEDQTPDVVKTGHDFLCPASHLHVEWLPQHAAEKWG
jgi:hypothetical protein